MAQMNYNPAGVDTTDTFAAMPNGDYPYQFVESEIKESKATPGNQYLQLVAQVIDGPYKGKKVWVRLNLWNASAQTAEIANKEMARICEAIGQINPVQDSAELHNRPFIGRTIYVPPNNGYDEGNDIKGFKPFVAGTAVPAGAAPAQAAAPAGAPPAGATPPQQGQPPAQQAATTAAPGWTAPAPQ